MRSACERLRCERAVRAARGRKEQREDRAVLATVLDTRLSMMLLHDVLYHRQAQADALFLAVTDEGLKQAGADLCWNARTVVCNPYLGSAMGDPAAHVDRPRAGR